MANMKRKAALAKGGEPPAKKTKTTHQCGHCGRNVPLSVSMEEHRKTCRYKRCFRCGKKMLKEEADEHKKSCAAKPAKRCSKCSKSFPAEKIDEHKKYCRAKRCSKCNKPFPAEKLDEHRGNCTWWRCGWCGKRMPGEKRARHQQETCERRNKRCSRCGKQIRNDDYDQHKKICTWRQCGKCNKYFPAEKLDAHKKNCTRWRCPRCMKRMSVEERASHQQETCERRQKTCPQCRKAFRVEAYDEHRKNCSWKACHRCGRGFLVEELIKHRSNCPWWRCRCNKPMPREERDSHIKTCDSWAKEKTIKVCQRCGKRFPQDDVEKHTLECPLRRCVRCRKIFTVEEIASHKNNCTWWCCGGCKKCMPGQERDSHSAACEKLAKIRACVRCRGCGKKFPRDDLEKLKNHKQVCKSYICYRCHKTIRKENKESHLQDCRKTLPRRCDGCEAFMTDTEFQAHAEVCRLRVCPQCKKKRLTDEQLDVHLKTCDRTKCFRCQRLYTISEGHKCQRQICSLCRRRVPIDTEHTCESWYCGTCTTRYPVEERNHHECPKERCNQCSKRVPRGEDHECLFFYCRGCCRRLPGQDEVQHRAECNKCRCWRCGRIMERHELQAHKDTVCPFVRCYMCMRAVPRSEADLHRSQCSPPRLPPLTARIATFTPGQVRGAILDPTTQYPLSIELIHTMMAWMKEPRNTAYGDFEFVPFPDERLPVQVAIANGNGSWIVPPTTINLGLTKRALLEKLRQLPPGLPYKICKNTIHKFYRSSPDDITQGLTCREIADLIHEYTEENGPIKKFIGWAMNSCDYACLAYILARGGREDLLPDPHPSGAQPLMWWSRLRKKLKFTAADMSLSLSHFHWLIFPEDAELISRAHDAGADVTMLLRLAWSYVLRAADIPLSGNIGMTSDSQSGGAGWRLGDAQRSSVLEFLERRLQSFQGRSEGVRDEDTDRGAGDGEDEVVDYEQLSEADYGEDEVVDCEEDSEDDYGEDDYGGYDVVDCEEDSDDDHSDDDIVDCEEDSDDDHSDDDIVDCEKGSGEDDGEDDVMDCDEDSGEATGVESPAEKATEMSEGSG